MNVARRWFLKRVLGVVLAGPAASAASASASARPRGAYFAGLDATPWVNVPHAATDPVVAAMVARIEADAMRELRPFLHYMNEAWEAA